MKQYASVGAVNANNKQQKATKHVHSQAI